MHLSALHAQNISGRIHKKLVTLVVPLKAGSLRKGRSVNLNHINILPVYKKKNFAVNYPKQKVRGSFKFC